MCLITVPARSLIVTQPPTPILNRGLRFSKNLRLSHRKRSKDLHDELKIQPLNTRIDKLSNKALNKMKALFYYEEGHHPKPTYKYDPDYEINDDPIYLKLPSLAQKIDEVILQPLSITNPIRNAPELHDWKPPPPVYT